MTTTAFITHRDCLLHDMGSHHPECPQRLTAINDHLIAQGIDAYFVYYDAPLATLQDWFGEYRDRLVAIDEATTEIPTFTDDPAHVPSWLIGLPYDYRVLGDDAVREACARAARRMAVAAEADN